MIENKEKSILKKGRETRERRKKGQRGEFGEKET
jgi:hypothetical protein